MPKPAKKKAVSKNLSKRAPRAYYVPSTHWDREWYEPFQHYRVRLVDVIDDLLDLMEQDEQYAFYMLDGQTIVLEDYLEIRPENFERLQALITEGRIEVGPWYVQPDESIPCGESLVRNLVLGHQIASEFATPLQNGFACDIFGQVSQLPQIFNGFGLDTATIWRGVNSPDEPGLFHWKSPDGSSVLTYCFIDGGYGQYQFGVRHVAMTPERTMDLDKALEAVKAVVAIEHNRLPGDAVLLFDGQDHRPVEPATSALIRRATKAGLDVRHARITDFFDDVRRQKLRLKTFEGELRDPGRYPGQAVIPGVLSSRIHLKQRNAECETLLLRWVEPFSALAALLGRAYPTTYIDQCWRWLLQNHPHDSICGCSIDQVHQDMLYRFDQCRQIGQRTRAMTLRHIADCTKLPKLEDDEDYAVTVFNPTCEEIAGVVNVPLYFNRNTKNRFNEFMGYEPIVGFRLVDERGQEVPYQRLDVTKLKARKQYDRLQDYRQAKKEQVNVAVKLTIPANGWTTLTCKPTTDRTRPRGSQLVDDRTMANEHLEVRVNNNGTLRVTDKAVGVVYDELMKFEDRADIGDGWYHGIAVNDECFTSVGRPADVALIHDGAAQTTFRVRVVMNVPKRFLLDEQVMRRSEELTELVITSWVTLKAGERRVEVRTEINNTACDHRVRVLFPTGLDVDEYLTDSAFDVITRRVGLVSDFDVREELDVEGKPQATWTAVSDRKRGLAVVTVGQPESAVRDLPGRPIALTLMRGFQHTVDEEGEMGGQILGKTSHVYWIVPHSGATPTSDLCRLGQLLAAGVECVYTEKTRQRLIKNAPVLPAAGSWFAVGKGPLVVTACKVSEDGEAIVIRAFNPTTKETQQSFEFFTKAASAHLTNLLEVPQTKLTVRGKTVVAPVGPKKIVTLRVELAPLVAEA